MQTYTQPYTVLLDHCPAPGVYLRWLAPLGDYPGWLFTGDTDTTTSPEPGSAFRPDSGAAQLLRRPAANRLLLRAGNLLAGQHQALSTLLTSPAVFIQDQQGQLTPVLVSAATVGRTSSDSRTTFDVEIELPTPNALTRA